MPRTGATQLNIRSQFARERAALLARQTGMTITQIVEEALRAYLPPVGSDGRAGLVRKGAILVRPAEGLRVGLAEADAALDQVRAERA